MKLQLGRHVFGLAAILFGLVSLTWHDFNTWQQIGPLGKVPHREVFASIVAAIEILGGFVIQWKKTARYGAIVLGVIYFAFAILWVPYIIAKPLVYDSWGNFFEQFSLVSGALIVFALASNNNQAARMGYIFFGICVISFMLEQLFYLGGTAGFVPGWIPPNRMFWAVTTTIAFALAAFALLSGISSLLASRLLTIMIVLFGLLIWLPAPFADPHNMINWAANAENLAIAGSAWIVADYLCKSTSLKQPLQGSRRTTQRFER